jgi:hypothetical protein
MRLRTTLTLAILMPACLVVAGWSPPRSTRPSTNLSSPATQSGSVSGKISAVGTDAFTVEVQKSQDAVTLKFLIDGATKVDGQLKVGSMVSVDYRTEDVKNIAVHVVVQPAAQS